jgi:hypothetical protein
MHLRSVGVAAQAKFFYRNVLALEATSINVCKTTAIASVLDWDIYSINKKRRGKFVGVIGKSDKEV